MHVRLTWAIASIAVLSLGACGGGGSEPSNESAKPEVVAPPAAAVDSATAGNINGKIVLEGAAPKNEAIRMNADPVCVREAKGPQAQETFIVGEGGALQNVFVYVKEGLGDRQFDVPTEAFTLDQKGCRYHPHVFGVRVNQPLVIVNSDPTLHNIHAVPKANQEFNNGQPIQGMKTTHTFTSKEVMVPFKCDVHGWMNAYAGVMDHPYFAVTGDNGSFELKSLPPGSYVVEAWHEKLGAMTQNITVGEKETKEVTFTFKAS